MVCPSVREITSGIIILLSYFAKKCGGGGFEKKSILFQYYLIYFHETFPTCTLLCCLYELVQGNSEFLGF